MRINVQLSSAEQRFHLAVWRMMDKLMEELLPEKQVGSIIKYTVSLDASLQGYDNQIKQNEIIDYLKDLGAIEEIGVPDLIELGEQGSHTYSAYHRHHFKILDNYFRLYDQYNVHTNENASVNSYQIPLTINTALPTVSYDAISGVGYINQNRFKFKDHQPEYRVFAELFRNINLKVSRKSVLKLMGYNDDNNQVIKARKSDETFAINELVTKIKKRTSLNKDQLINNNGNLTLRGVKLDLSPPKPH